MQELSAAIKKAVPAADVTSSVGRRTSFEVTVNDTVIHSKLATMKFPDFEEVVEIVTKVEGGGQPDQVTKVQESSCTIL
jgi:selenoprotein W-related protein